MVFVGRIGVILGISIILLPISAFIPAAFGITTDSLKKQMKNNFTEEEVACGIENTREVNYSSNLTCKPSNIRSEEATKERASGKHNTQENVLTVKVVDRKTESPISDATVIIIAKSGKIVAWKITDRNGMQQLHVPSGDYYIMIKASCCYSKMDNLHIKGDMEKIIELVDR
jgi:hypothetical protein